MASKSNLISEGIPSIIPPIALPWLSPNLGRDLHPA